MKRRFFLAKGTAITAFLVIAPSVAIAPSVNRPATVAGDQVAAIEATATVPEAVNGSAQAATIPDPSARKESVTKVFEIKSGDTLMKLALDTGVPRRDAHGAITALRKIYNPRNVRPGQTLTVTYLPEDEDREDPELRGLQLDANAYQGYAVTRSDDKTFVANELVKELKTELARATGAIGANLFDDGEAAGMPAAVLIDLIRLYSWDVDFQRDLQPGDIFDVVFERIRTVDGDFVRDGEIIYSRLVLSGKALPLYRHEYAKDRWDYFDENGQSARKPLLRTPVDGGRLSSRYGRRKHPILGYNRMHRGVDFAAPRGTPIYAAGDGVVAQAGRKGGYGRYIRVRHNSDYSTAYAHMWRFKKGIRSGSRVKQGQVIGYVGSSGRSTGPHLHYEILRKGRQVNPLRVKMPSGRKLKGTQLAAFQEARQAVDQRVAGLISPVQVAKD